MAGVKDAIRSSNPFAGRTPGIDELMDGMLHDPEPEVRVVEKVVEQPALMLAEDGTIPARNFTITSTGLIMLPDASKEDWESVGMAILKFETGMQWLIGDWLNYGDLFNYSVEQIASILNRDFLTLKNWASLAKTFPQTRRRDSLFFGHHDAVRGLDPNEQDVLLDIAARDRLSVAELRKRMKKLRGKSGRVTPALKRFNSRWSSFQERLKPIVAEVSSADRKQIADRLRKAADEIEAV